jgi:hypothetical protein
MSIPFQFVRSLTGPQLIVSGTEMPRYPNLEIGNGLTLTDNPSVPSYTLGFDYSYVNAMPSITGSVGGVTFINTLTPRYVVTGTIASGSNVSITCSLVNNTSAQTFARVTTRNSTLQTTNYTKALLTHTTLFSGSSAKSDFVDIVDDNFFAVSMSLSSSVSGSSLIYTFACNTGSFPYTFFIDQSSYSF